MSKRLNNQNNERQPLTKWKTVSRSEAGGLSLIAAFGALIRGNPKDVARNLKGAASSLSGGNAKSTVTPEVRDTMRVIAGNRPQTTNYGTFSL